MPLSSFPPRKESTHTSGAPVTTASWVVWAVAAPIMATAYVIVHEVHRAGGWWDVAVLSVTAVLATVAGNRTGRRFEAWDAERNRAERSSDPRSVREATTLAAFACGMATNGAWNDVLPSWTRFVVLVIWGVVLAVLVVFAVVERRRTSDH